MAWDREKERKAGKAMSIGSSVFGLIFAIFWCIAAASMGAGFMLIFGIPFVGMMIYRLYVISQYAKDDKPKEQDPWDQPVRETRSTSTVASGNGFCPYCGSAIQPDFEYCPKCGRKQT